jgi:hypothetical protein
MRRPMISQVLLPLFLGFFLLLNVLDEPRLQGLRGVDWLRLITVGFGLGVAFTMLVWRRSTRSSDVGAEQKTDLSSPLSKS